MIHMVINSKGRHVQAVDVKGEVAEMLSAFCPFLQPKEWLKCGGLMSYPLAWQLTDAYSSDIVEHGVNIG